MAAPEYLITQLNDSIAYLKARIALTEDAVERLKLETELNEANNQLANATRMLLG